MSNTIRFKMISFKYKGMEAGLPGLRESIAQRGRGRKIRPATNTNNFKKGHIKTRNVAIHQPITKQTLLVTLLKKNRAWVFPNCRKIRKQILFL